VVNDDDDAVVMAMTNVVRAGVDEMLMREESIDAAQIDTQSSASPCFRLPALTPTAPLPTPIPPPIDYCPINREPALVGSDDIASAGQAIFTQ